MGADMGVVVKRTQNEQQKNFDKAIEDLKKIDEVAQVGWFENAKYPNGTQVAYVALIQENGASDGKTIIPPRPFFKPTLRDNKTKYLNKLKFGVKKILKGESSVREILEGIGEIVSEDIKKAIKKITSPPLAEATLARRAAKLKIKVEQLSETGRKPLVDTGTLEGSVESRIGKK